MQPFFAFDVPAVPLYIVSGAVALVVIYKGVLEDLIKSLGGLAAARKELLEEEKREHEKTSKRLDQTVEAYAIALIEVDTSRKIRGEHNERIRQLEYDLAVARGLDPQAQIHSSTTERNT
jgi:hypothetical protein